MERKGEHYLNECHPAVQEHLSMMLADLEGNLCMSMLLATVSGFFMVEYFGLPSFDGPPHAEMIEAMFTDLVERGFADVIETKERNEHGMLSINYRLPKVIEYIGGWLTKLAGNPALREVFEQQAKLCSATALAKPSLYLH